MVAQLLSDWEIGLFLHAGAAEVYTRRSAPADIAANLLAAVAQTTSRHKAGIQ